MKRLHLHVSVPDLDQSIRFYAILFGAPPSVVKDDYAKWMLDDPRVNFAISTHREPGLEHLGIQVDSAAELGELSARLKAAGAETFDEAATTCCYAQSDKSWVGDPAGLRWETFYTFGEATSYGASAALAELEQTQAKAAGGCCGPAATKAAAVAEAAESSSGCCG